MYYIEKQQRTTVRKRTQECITPTTRLLQAYTGMTSAGSTAAVLDAEAAAFMNVHQPTGERNPAGAVY